MSNFKKVLNEYKNVDKMEIMNSIRASLSAYDISFEEISQYELYISDSTEFFKKIKDYVDSVIVAIGSADLHDFLVSYNFDHSTSGVYIRLKYK